MGSGLLVWNAILGGDADLSLTVTTINTLLTYGEFSSHCIHWSTFLISFFLLLGVVIPLWVFLLGETVLKSENLNPSYGYFLLIITFLLVTLIIGVLIQHFYPKSVEFAMQSLFWLLYIYVFGYDIYLIVFYWNLFAPKLFPITWKVSST